MCEPHPGGPCLPWPAACPASGGLGRGLMSLSGSLAVFSSSSVKSGMADLEPSTRTMLGLCKLCGDGSGRCGLLTSPAELRSLQ